MSKLRGSAKRASWTGRAKKTRDFENWKEASIISQFDCATLNFFSKIPIP
jgi:hypothetical protein